MASSPLRRAFPCVFPDEAAEIIAVPEAGLFRDLRKRETGILQQGQCALQTQHTQVFRWRDIHFFTENAEQGGPVKIQFAGQGLDIQGRVPETGSADHEDFMKFFIFKSRGVHRAARGCQDIADFAEHAAPAVRGTHKEMFLEVDEVLVRAGARVKRCPRVSEREHEAGGVRTVENDPAVFAFLLMSPDHIRLIRQTVNHMSGAQDMTFPVPFKFRIASDSPE